MKGISVIICCYNSSSRLPETLRHLAAQVIPDSVSCEVILVNNASTDNTVEVAQAEWEKYSPSNIDFRIIYESRPGTSFARQKGIIEARYAYYLFCDDDNWLNPNYLSTGFSILENDKEIGGLGGMGIPEFGGPKPDWFDKYAMYYAVGPQAPASGDISRRRGWVYGAGCFVRKEAVENMDHYQFITTDRKGTSLSSGGDIELCYYILLHGYKIWYDERLTFTHYIEGRRLSLDYIKRMLLAHAQEAYQLDGLEYKSRANQDFNLYNKKFQRMWIFRFLFDAVKLKKAYYEEFPIKFLFKLYITRLNAILKLNSRFDQSFQ
ncbi:Glycosyltransferase, GT2 family [Spirosoma fluviale]|uniref:Glycosyltransferase, GT2 family n=2 Tax=Spirosoma fluviale TaxID=1597977 RepID=A0A286G2C5_9BACT|nr:Glycosyltransferase, GT2 family [Spirosoma fluviale]